MTIFGVSLSTSKRPPKRCIRRSTDGPRRKMEPITFPCRFRAVSPDHPVPAPARCAMALGGFGQGVLFVLGAPSLYEIGCS